MFMTQRRTLLVSLILVAIAATLCAQSRGGQRSRGAPGTGNPDEHLVPWKFLPKGDAIVKGPLVVYWLPAKLDEVTRSPLLTSSILLENTTRCVGLQIVVPDDAETIEKFGATGKLPMAVIIDNSGRVVRQVNNTNGVLRPQSVEQMVSAELRVRDDQVFRDLTRAKKEKSIDLYKKIWDDRCLYPLVGLEAQHALKDLGVIVKDVPAPPPPDPNLKVTKPTTTSH
jgi:hypothetical protein